MKRNLIALFLIICIFSNRTYAQLSENGNIVVSSERVQCFYVGIENPINISMPKGYSLVKLETSNGEIKGEGFKRVVIPKEVGNCIITQTVKAPTGFEWVTSFSFRVRYLPDPQLFIGEKPASSYTYAESLKGQDRVSVQMQDVGGTYFNSLFQLQEVTIGFSGVGFSEEKKVTIKGNSLKKVEKYITQTVPGSMINFTNIKYVTASGSSGQLSDCVITLK